MIKVEILEQIKEGVLVREAGDICSIHENLANAYIKAGLAKNVETGEVGQRTMEPVKVNLDPVTIQTSVN